MVNKDRKHDCSCTETFVIMIKNFRYKTILSYCLKCKENTERINPKVSETNNSKTMLL